MSKYDYMSRESLEHGYELYQIASFRLAELILKYQAEDISKEQLFEELKTYMSETYYDLMYHDIVVKDNLGFTGNLLKDLDADVNYVEDDSETSLHIINKEEGDETNVK